MKLIPISRLACAALAALAGVGGCSKLETGQSEMSWARAALERNDRLEVVAADAQANSFTVRLKDTGELRVLRLDQLVAGPKTSAGPAAAGAAGAALANAPATAANAPAEAPAPAAPAAPAQTETGASATHGSTIAPGTAAAPAAQSEPGAADSPPEAAPAPRSERASGAAVGHVLASGPGYSVKAAGAKGVPPRGVAGSGPAASAAVERRHDPIICQGDRFLQIDNRNLEFDGDAVSAEDGCEIHITNSRISAKGVGVSARKANVHIENSQIEGDSGSVDASQGAQVYSASSTFKGLRRREDDAVFHDLGGNVWN